MKANELYISAQTERRTFRASVQSWLNRGNGIYSQLMDDYITNRQAVLITNTLVSLALMVAFAASSPIIVLALAGWVLLSFRLCKKGGLK